MERISRRQMILIGAAYTLDATIINVPNQVIGAAKMDSWLSYLIGMAVIAIALWALARVSHRFPGKDLFTILAERSPVAGRVAAGLFILLFFIILARDIRMLTDFVDVVLLPNTPLTMIALLIVLSAVFIARGGVEMLARMTELWFPVLLFVILTIPLILFRDFDPKFLRPFFDEGIVPPLLGSWYIVAYLGEIIAMPLLFSSGTFRFKDGMIALGIGTLALLLLNTYAILSLGVHIPSKMMFPIYEMVRQIQLTDFLDRFDLPLVGIWLPSMLTKTAYSLFIVVHGLHRMFPKLSARELVAPMGVMAYVCSFWFFRNGLQLLDLNRLWPCFSLICQLLLPLLFLFWLRKKKKNSPAPPAPTV